MQEIGIVHRDLKSANVLLETVPLNEREAVLRAVVCDFGVAQVTSAATVIDQMKLKDVGGFSPRYAAPEVFASAVLMASNDSEVNKQSDVYSFAIILWELLTRQTPWNGFTKNDIEISVRNSKRVSDPLLFFFSIS